MNRLWREFRENAGQLINHGMSKKRLADILKITPNQLIKYVVEGKRPPKPEAKKIKSRLDNYLNNREVV